MLGGNLESLLYGDVSVMFSGCTARIVLDLVRTPRQIFSGCSSYSDRVLIFMLSQLRQCLYVFGQIKL